MNSYDQIQPVAVIGLGSMGWGAATSLLRSGIPTHGVDIRQNMVDQFSDAGGTGFVSAAKAAAGAQVVFTFVVNSEQTESVLFGEHGAVSTMPSGGVVVGCATVPPDFAVELESRLNKYGLLYIDAPVSGGALKAQEGAMTIMASGCDAAFNIVSPLFESISTKVFRLGELAGAASKIKMINQLLAGIHIASACEATAFAIRNGIDPGTLYEVICECAGNSWMFENRVPHILDGNYDPASAVNIFIKDLGIVTEQAKHTGFATPLADVALELFKAAAERGYGSDDDASVVKVYAEKSGIELPG